MSVARAIHSAKVLAAATLIVAVAAFGAGASRAAEGPNLPPAEYKPLPVGTKIEYDHGTYTVARTEGYTTVFKKQTRGGTASWIQTHGLFGDYGADIYATYTRNEPNEFAFFPESRKKLEALWPLAVGKETTYQLDERAAFYAPRQVWTVSLRVSGTETIDTAGQIFETYVVEERIESDGGMSFSGRKWYHPATGLIVRSTRVGTGVNAVGAAHYFKDAVLGKDQEETFALRKVDFPPGATTAVVAAAPTTTPAAAPLQGAGPALPPAVYRPLPVGTKFQYDNGTVTVARTEGFTTVLKKQGRSGTAWVSLHAVFGEYGSDVYSKVAGGQPKEFDLGSEDKARLEALWPLAVGKQTTYQLSESGRGFRGAQNWTITLKVAGTETIETGGRRLQTYVIEERAKSDFGMSFSGHKWYSPEIGVVVRQSRIGTGKDSFGVNTPTIAILSKDQQEVFALLHVDFPPGTDAVLVAAAQGTATAGKPTATAAKPAVPAAQPQVTKVEPVARPTEEARKARDAEIAQLKQEAEQVFKAREAEMAKRLKDADEARKASEVEIAKLKQDADRTLKTREAEIARLRQSLAERRDDKAGAAGDAASAFSGVEFGHYHALVIGIDNYKHLPKLNTAVNDARAIAEVLEKDYGFTVTLLLEPTRNDVVDALDVYREKLGRNDNLLIYYAGHGWLDREVDRGYWLPVDAEPKRRRDWVSNATITDTLKALSAKHVMVVADSCYSGTLVRSADVGTRTRTGDYWKQMATKWARVAITSGGLEPVADSGSGGHSPFAKAFIAALGENAEVMDGTQLFSQMRRPVMVNAQQTPQYADVREAGHDGGDFLFVKKK